MVSVDTKKKELVGPYKNAGRTWREADDPEIVNEHDFIDKELGKAIPYGKLTDGWARRSARQRRRLLTSGVRYVVPIGAA